MSVARIDDRINGGASMVEEIRRTAQRRLHEIEPLLEEAERLRDVLRALDTRPAGTETRHTADVGSRIRASRDHSQSKRRSRGSAATSSESSRPRAPKGANKRVIIELVGHSPGITAAQISETTGMKRTVVASTVSRLKRYGELCDHERGGLRLPSSDGSAPPELGERSRRLAPLRRQRAA